MTVQERETRSVVVLDDNPSLLRRPRKLFLALQPPQLVRLPLARLLRCRHLVRTSIFIRIALLRAAEREGPRSRRQFPLLRARFVLARLSRASSRRSERLPRRVRPALAAATSRARSGRRATLLVLPRLFRALALETVLGRLFFGGGLVRELPLEGFAFFTLLFRRMRRAEGKGKEEEKRESQSSGGDPTRARQC